MSSPLSAPARGSAIDGIAALICAVLVVAEPNGPIIAPPQWQDDTQAFIRTAFQSYDSNWQAARLAGRVALQGTLTLWIAQHATPATTPCEENGQRMQIAQDDVAYYCPANITLYIPAVTIASQAATHRMNALAEIGVGFGAFQVSLLVTNGLQLKSFLQFGYLRLCFLGVWAGTMQTRRLLDANSQVADTELNVFADAAARVPLSEPQLSSQALAWVQRGIAVRSFGVCIREVTTA